MAEASTTTKGIKACLAALLVMFILATLSLQAFMYAVNPIGEHVGAGDAASLITALPAVFMGLAAFVYASMADFIPLKKIFVVGFIIFILGSLMGFFFNFNNLAMVVIARSIQAFGGQAAGSCFLVLAGRYLSQKERVVFFGIFTASYQFSAGLGSIAAGVLANFEQWPALFLIPCVSLLVLYPALKNMPEKIEGIEEGQGIDAIGYALFTFFITFLMLFFNMGYIWLYLWISLAFLVVFIIYICKAKNPFITPAFFMNGRWVLAYLVLTLVWFTGYSALPLAQAIGTTTLQLDSFTMSLVLLIPIAAATICGVLSGKIIGVIGRSKTLILAVVLQCLGFLASALVLSPNWVPLAITLAIYWGGYGMLYSPMVDTVISTVKPSEIGRGFGMNDLMVSVSPSIGLAVFNPMILAAQAGVGAPNFIPGVSDPFVYGFPTIFFLFAIPGILGIILFLFTKNYINGETKDQAK